MQLNVLLLTLVVVCHGRTKTETFNPSETETRTDTSEATLTLELPMTSTITLSQLPSATDTLVDSGTATTTISPPSCVANTVVWPGEYVKVPLGDVTGSPRELQEVEVGVFRMSAVVFAQEGLTVTRTLQRAIFPEFLLPPGFPQSTVFLSCKDRLMYDMFADAEEVIPITDFDSDQNHGLLRMISKNRGIVLYDISLHSTHVHFTAFEGYRITRDEFLYLNFYSNASLPKLCNNTGPVIVQVTAFHHGWLYTLTQAICFVTLLSGVAAGIGQSSIPTAHHSGIIAILAGMHFAQEDGLPLPMSIHPLQIGVGDDKYKYVRAATIFNTTIVMSVVVAQLIGIFIMIRSKYGYREARLLVKYPRAFVVVAVFLSPSVFFGAARYLGNQTTGAFFASSAAIVLILCAIAIGFRRVWSVQKPFKAFFCWEGDEDGKNKFLSTQGEQLFSTESLLADTQRKLTEEEKRQRARDKSFLDRFNFLGVLQVRGTWISWDKFGSFVEIFGFAFENSVGDIKWWMGAEIMDFALTAMITVLDNYTPWLAFVQFSVTVGVKFAMLLMVMIFEPLVHPKSMQLLLLIYTFQCLAALALLVGGLRRQLLWAAEQLHAVACLMAALTLLLDCFFTAARAIVHFRLSVVRSRKFTVRRLEDEIGECDVELSNGTVHRGDGLLLFVGGELPESASGVAYERRKKEYLEWRAHREKLRGEDVAAYEAMKQQRRQQQKQQEEQRQYKAQQEKEASCGREKREDEDEECNSQYDSDGLPSLDHPVYRRNEEKRVRREMAQLQGETYCSSDEEDKKGQTTGPKQITPAVESDALLLQSIGKCQKMSTAKRASLWEEIERTSRGKKILPPINVEDFERL